MRLLRVFGIVLLAAMVVSFSGCRLVGNNSDNDVYQATGNFQIAVRNGNPNANVIPPNAELSLYQGNTFIAGPFPMGDDGYVFTGLTFGPYSLRITTPLPNANIVRPNGVRAFNATVRFRLVGIHCGTNVVPSTTPATVSEQVVTIGSYGEASAPAGIIATATPGTNGLGSPTVQVSVATSTASPPATIKEEDLPEPLDVTGSSSAELDNDGDGIPNLFDSDIDGDGTNDNPDPDGDGVIELLVSAPTHTAQSLKCGETSTSTVQSTKAGKIYFVKRGEAAVSQAQIDTASAAHKAFLAKDGAVADTPYTVTLPLGLVEGPYDLVAVGTLGNVSPILTGWLTVVPDLAVSAPINTQQVLRSGNTSTSTVQSTKAGKIYLVKRGEPAATQAQINSAIAAHKAFLGKDGAAANTAYTVTLPAGLVDGPYDLVAVDSNGNLSAIVSGWLIVGIDYTSANIGTMKYVPAGTFQRDEISGNTSTVSTFRMSQYEVTQDQYVAVTGWINPGTPVLGNGPVNFVSWHSTLVFCNKLSMSEGLTPAYTINSSTDPAAWAVSDPDHLAPVTCNFTANGYRLPTEAEWQWAAMGATDSRMKKFAGALGTTDSGWDGGTIDAYAWWSGGSVSSAHAVGGKKANELGIYDLSGNLFEWCWDWLANYPSDAQTNYTGPNSGVYRVLRGGSWAAPDWYNTVATRVSNRPSSETSDYGFRVVRP